MRRALPIVLVLLAGCAPRGGPGPTAEAYAEALREGRLDRAWETLDPEARAGLSREAWASGLTDPDARRAEAERVGEAGRPGAVVARPERPPALVRRDDRWYVLPPPPPAPPPTAEARVTEVLGRFVAAAEAGDFETVWRLLSPDLRARYTPDTLARDHAAARSEAAAAVGRIRAALDAGAPVEIEGGAAYVRLGGGRAVRLVHEGDAWRVTELH